MCQLLISSFCLPPAARLHAAPPPLRLRTVLAPQRRIVSPVAPPVAALFTEPSSETAAAQPTTAPRLHPHCPMIQELSHNNAGALRQGSLARSPPSLSAGQWRLTVWWQTICYLVLQSHCSLGLWSYGYGNATLLSKVLEIKPVCTNLYFLCAKVLICEVTEGKFSFSLEKRSCAADLVSFPNLLHFIFVHIYSSVQRSCANTFFLFW